MPQAVSPQIDLRTTTLESSSHSILLLHRSDTHLQAFKTNHKEWWDRHGPWHPKPWVLCLIWSDFLVFGSKMRTSKQKNKSIWLCHYPTLVLEFQVRTHLQKSPLLSMDRFHTYRGIGHNLLSSQCFSSSTLHISLLEIHLGISTSYLSHNI